MNNLNQSKIIKNKIQKIVRSTEAIYEYFIGKMFRTLEKNFESHHGHIMI